VLSKRLTNWCEDNIVIEESQAGFRSQCSTVDNIFTLNGIVQKYLGIRWMYSQETMVLLV